MGTRRSLLQRLTASAQKLDAADLRDDVVQRRCESLDCLRHAEKAQVVGRLRSVVYTPSETVPTLVAELYDGSDSLDLVWLGRRRIVGIEPGAKILARGRIGEHDGRRAIYNPHYELLPRGAS